MADVPRYGRGMVEEITLSPDHSEVADLHLFINDGGKVAMYHGNAFSETEAFAVFPNPVGRQMQLAGLQSFENYAITITDALGNVVYHADVKADVLGQVCIALGIWSKGVYCLHAVGCKTNQSVKFIKL